MLGPVEGDGGEEWGGPQGGGEGGPGAHAQLARGNMQQCLTTRDELTGLHKVITSIIRDNRNPIS